MRVGIVELPDARDRSTASDDAFVEVCVVDRRGDDRDAGQAMGLVLMTIALVATVMVGVASLSARLTDRSRAQNAADAAALAGVVGGAGSAAEAARRNGAALASFRSSAGGRQATGSMDATVEVTVEVVIGDEHAVARASNAP